MMNHLKAFSPKQLNNYFARIKDIHISKTLIYNTRLKYLIKQE